MIYILGLGPGDISSLSLGAYKLLFSGKKVFLRTKKHPIIEELEIEGLKYESFDSFYENELSFENVYSNITNYLVNEGSNDFIYAVPGHPLVAENSVTDLIHKLNKLSVSYEIVPSMSFLDSMFSSLEIDPSEGFVLLDSTSLECNDISDDKHIIITQIYDKFIASEIKLKLQETFMDDEFITLINSAGIKGEEKIKTLQIDDMDKSEWDFNHLTSLYIKKKAKRKYKSIYDLIDVINSLRGENGCPWDIEQTKETLAPMFLEEVQEVIEAIKNDDIDNLIEELGDVLLHIIFQTQLGEEDGYFSLNDVTTRIVEKMIRRHPHVFGETIVNNVEEVNLLWNEIKKGEKSIK